MVLPKVQLSAHEQPYKKWFKKKSPQKKCQLKVKVPCYLQDNYKVSMEIGTAGWPGISSGTL